MDAGCSATETKTTTPPNAIQSASSETASNSASSSSSNGVVAILSKPQWPQVNGALNMTVGSGISITDGQNILSSSDSSSSNSSSSFSNKNEIDEDVPINLSPTGRNGPSVMSSNATQETAQDLSRNSSSLVSTIGLSAKMRLKKQRLASLAAENNSPSLSLIPVVLPQQQQQDEEGPSPISPVTLPPQHPPPVTASSASTGNIEPPSINWQESALHRLAEVAERKKEEEEMMECDDETTPRGTPTPMFSIDLPPPPPSQLLRKQPSKSLMEYEISTFSATSSLGATASPVVARQYVSNTPATPSPDSAIHSAYYSPAQSPVQSRHLSGFSSPFSLRTTPSLSRNNSDASQYSQYSSNSPPNGYSPNQSPVPGRHHVLRPQHSPIRHLSLPPFPISSSRPSMSNIAESNENAAQTNVAMTSNDEKPPLNAQTGISRQQLINSPCPVCGDKISGFHYGIFSCESCKGFFKRTVQNKKNYVCLRGAQCPVSIATRKKCPACRFDKCLKTGMKLEAIREDRTRGGRSTYQCSYTLPPSLTLPMTTSSGPSSLPPSLPSFPLQNPLPKIKREEEERNSAEIPQLLQEIMDVEHLWFSNGGMDKCPTSPSVSKESSNSEDMVQTLTLMADKRLYKLVKWCKSLPLFKHILIDDQIALLINAWCELLVFSCCYRSVDSPGVIRVSRDKSLTLEAAKGFGIEKCIEKMLNFSEQLRRLKVDHFEYVGMKVIVLLTSDASGLKEPEHVRDSQEKVVQALQQYTTYQYPTLPSKFGELLLRMPELQRVCQVGKEMLCPRTPAGRETPGFNLLMELLRGDH